VNTSTDRHPLVSVIIPYYSQSAYIAETIESVRRQTHPNIELIVVDDGSAEDQQPALHAIKDLTVFRIPNSGPPAARNFGFAKSTGEYLVFLDADDVLVKDAIETNLRTLLANPKAVMSFGAGEVIDSFGKVLIPSRVSFPRRNYFYMLLETNPIWSPGATIVQRAAFEKIGGFPDLRKFQADDYEFYLRLARVGELCQHSDCVLQYRKHTTNMSGDKKRMLDATLETMDRINNEFDLSLFERVQLWHGKMRWRHEFSQRTGFIAKLKSQYFRKVTLWNIDVVHLVRVIGHRARARMRSRADVGSRKLAHSRDSNKQAAIRR
jgi:glycosyltransferase involved in cell wall biosynthesis